MSEQEINYLENKIEQLESMVEKLKEQNEKLKKCVEFCHNITNSHDITMANIWMICETTREVLKEIE